MKVLLRAPVLSQSGYGEHARFILRSLQQTPGITPYVINTAWGQTSWTWENSEERSWFDERLVDTIGYMNEDTKGNKFDLSIQVGLPIEWGRLAPKNIGVTAGIETDKVLDSWDTSANDMDAIIVPSEHSKSGFSEETQKKISVISFSAVSREADLNVDDKLDSTIDTKFNFLTVAQLSPRKNIDTSLLAFLEEFQNHEDVGYVLKINIRNNSLTDRGYVKESIDMLLENYPDRKCKVYVIHGNMTDAQMASLYSNGHISAYVSAAHGEGFGLPIFEAVKAGKPIIAPSWSGYTDFTTIKNKTQLVQVEYELREVKGRENWEGVLDPESKWAYVKLDDLRAKMKEVYLNVDKYNKQAKKLQKHVSEKYTEAKQSELVHKVIKEIME
jgi:glycosyltransferase involved in cell wall biosynthesis